MAREYTKLDKTEDYDHETVEQLAEAMTELRALKRRESYLNEIIEENRDLGRFIWGTLEGKLIPHHKIEDDHLRNIVNHVARSGRTLSKELKAECRKRGIDVPSEEEEFLLLADRIIDLTDEQD